jgi:hypothetical protein
MDSSLVRDDVDNAFKDRVTDWLVNSGAIVHECDWEAVHVRAVVSWPSDSTQGAKSQDMVELVRKMENDIGVRPTCRLSPASGDKVVFTLQSPPWFVRWQARRTEWQRTLFWVAFALILVSCHILLFKKGLSRSVLAFLFSTAINWVVPEPVGRLFRFAVFACILTVLVDPTLLPWISSTLNSTVNNSSSNNNNNTVPPAATIVL